MNQPIAKNKAFTGKMFKEALIRSLAKLNPTTLWKNPVMFIVEIGSALTTISWIQDHTSFSGAISLWLWFTVLFANFAEAIAEGRGKAQADTLKKARKDTNATVRLPDGKTVMKPSSLLALGDIVIVAPNEQIPGDGTVIEGAALIDESAITGESAPVVREAGGDRSAVTGGTTVLSDRVIIQITQEPGKSFLDQMIALVEGAVRQKTPNEIALNILLSGLTIIFLMAVATLSPFAIYSKVDVSLVILIALLVCLIPTTIGGLLSAIGIAGMDRLVKRNILAMSGRAVEAAGNIDVLILDKTGTITLGNRMASEFIKDDGISEKELIEHSILASKVDLTPEGRSVVSLGEKMGYSGVLPPQAEPIPFTAETRMSGVKINDLEIRKGAIDAVRNWLKLNGAKPLSETLENAVKRVASAGGTPLVVATQQKALGVIYLKDIVKPGISDRFKRIRAMGIRTIMVTGDNKLTAKAIATEADVDDFLAEAKPEDKLKIIRDLQAEGHLVAMSGDGTNDAPALAQADVGVVMNTGTQAAREAGNMLDLDSDPTKVIDVVEIGKQLLITRGSLTTFSIANDVAKYFAILPAIFAATYPGLQALNIMHLQSPKSAILSAVIFNALIIIVLIPLALKGVKYRAQSAASLLRYNVFVYGLGGIIAPFIGIKVIDLILVGFGYV